MDSPTFSLRNLRRLRVKSEKLRIAEDHAIRIIRISREVDEGCEGENMKIVSAGAGPAG